MPLPALLLYSRQPTAKRTWSLILDLIILSAGLVVLSFLVFIPFRFFAPRLALGAGALFAIYLGFDDLATVLPRLLPSFDVIGSNQWNWSGKLWSIVLAVLVMLALRLDREDIGLVAPKNMKVSMIAVGLLAICSATLGFVFDPGIPTAETVAFQALMPALAEELAYRGVAPAILLGLFRRDSTLQAQDEGTIPWNVILITSIMFGAWHGLSYGDGSFSFSPLPALFPFIGSVVYCWLRFYGGSLLFPILAHSLGNTVFLVPAIL